MTPPTIAATDDLTLRPGAPVLDRGDGELQLGTDERWSLVLAGLAGPEREWLAAAARDPHVSLERSAVKHRITPDRLAEIRSLLAASGFLVPRLRRAPDVLATAGGSADAPALGALLPDGAGMLTLARRGVRAVGISGLGRIGSLVATHLAAAGVGTLLLDDAGTVQVTDLGIGLYREVDTGRRRTDRLRSVLAERYPRAAVRRTWHEESAPDVVVVVCDGAARPESFARLMSADIAHVPVVLGEAGVQVGPFVLPGTTACTGCAHQHATDRDDRWPLLIGQLAGRPVGGQETVLCVTAAALTAGQVLAHLDGARPAAAGAVLEVALPEALPRRRPLEAHPGCGCTVPPE